MAGSFIASFTLTCGSSSRSFGCGSPENGTGSVSLNTGSGAVSFAGISQTFAASESNSRLAVFEGILQKNFDATITFDSFSFLALTSPVALSVTASTATTATTGGLSSSSFNAASVSISGDYGIQGPSESASGSFTLPNVTVAESQFPILHSFELHRNSTGAITAATAKSSFALTVTPATLYSGVVNGTAITLRLDGAVIHYALAATLS